MKNIPLILSVTSFLCLTAANAQLAHRYNLTDANDSVGTANGTINGAASFTTTAGMLTTTGGSGDYLSLPAAVGTGITGNFSIQTFVVLPTNPNNFSSLFSLSSPGNRNFFLVNPARPNSNGVLSANFQQKTGTVNGGNDTEVDVQSGAAFPFGTAEHDVTITYAATNNFITLYVDGASVASGSITNATSGTTFSLQDVTSLGNSGINGNGPFGDPSIVGSTDDFRVFSGTLTAAQVTALHNLGANATNTQIGVAGGGVVPEPSTWMMMLMGLVGLCGLQRLRRREA